VAFGYDGNAICLLLSLINSYLILIPSFSGICRSLFDGDLLEF